MRAYAEFFSEALFWRKLFADKWLGKNRLMQIMHFMQGWIRAFGHG